MPINLLAVLAAAIIAWVFGAIWYNVLGRVWREALLSRRQPAASAQTNRPPVRALAISFVAELVMAFMLAGLVVHMGGPAVKVGLIAGFFCWLGFVATTLVTGDAYLEERPTKTAIDAGHWLGVLLLQGLVIGLMG